MYIEERLDDIERRLRALEGVSEPNITSYTDRIATIRKAVADEWGMSPQDLNRHEKPRYLVEPRMMFQELCTKYVKAPRTTIAQWLQIDRRTLDHSVSKVEVLCTVDKAYKKKYDNVCAVLKQLLETKECE